MNPIKALPARVVSAALLVVALAGFALPFASEAYNTTQLTNMGLAITPAGQTCINDLTRFGFVTYSGKALLTGSDPTTDFGEPPSCTASGSLGQGVGASGDAHNYAVWPQSSLIAAVVLAFLGIAVGLTPLRRRALMAGVCAAAGLILLIAAQDNAMSAIVSRLSPATPLELLLQNFTTFAREGFFLSAASFGLAVMANLIEFLATTTPRQVETATDS